MTHEIIDHTADIQYKVRADSLEKLFIESAEVMQESFMTGKVKKKIKKNIEVQGKDFENLLYNFLEELLFLFDAEHFLFSEIKMSFDETSKTIIATLKGDIAEGYEIHSHIKAITYNEMYVKKKRGKWECLVTLDV
jgi:SHS2 domain-containing protein